MKSQDGHLSFYPTRLLMRNHQVQNLHCLQEFVIGQCRLACEYAITAELQLASHLPYHRTSE